MFTVAQRITLVLILRGGKLDGLGKTFLFVNEMVDLNNQSNIFMMLCLIVLEDTMNSSWERRKEKEKPFIVINNCPDETKNNRMILPKNILTVKAQPNSLQYLTLWYLTPVLY